MAEALVVLFRDDGTVSVGHTGDVACLHMIEFQPSLWRPDETSLMKEIREVLAKVKRMKRLE